MSQTKTQLVEGLSLNTSAPATALQIDASGNVNLDSNTLYVDATNNRVGIGSTTALGYKLNVYESGTGMVNALHLGSGSGNAGNGASISFGLGNTFDPTSNILAKVGSIYTGGNYGAALTFHTNAGSDAASPQERARIDSSGRLLVGTSSAFSTANVGTNYQLAIEQSGASSYASAQLRSNNSDTLGAYLGLCKSRGTTAGSNTVVQSGDTIGEITFEGADGSALRRAASIACYVDATPGANDMPGRIVLSTTADGASSPTERMRITNGGSVLTGITSATTISSSAKLQTSNIAVEVSADVTGSWWNRTDSNAAWVAQRFYAQGSQSGFIQVNTSSVTYSTTSDYRLKENVTPVIDGITRLQQLKPSRFNFIAEPGKTVDGFLAHEAQVVVPECATGTKDEVDDEGNPIYQGIDQSKLVPLLTAALQEAIGEIESLKARVAALESA